MRAIEWSDDALEDFEQAIAYIAAESPTVATAIAGRIFTSIELLAGQPTGRQGRVKGTYEKSVQKTPYIVAYAVSDQVITVLRVIHAKRDSRAGEWPAE